MGELQIQHPFSLPPPPLPPLPQPASSRDPAAPLSSSHHDPPPPPPPPFDPSRMIGIIRRKALIKDLAAVYHAECLTHCQELLELQKKVHEASNTTSFLMSNAFHNLFAPSKLFIYNGMPWHAKNEQTLFSIANVCVTSIIISASKMIMERMFCSF
ncbi:hypothetical protein CDL12_20331 [Handroanthus impetiginosus]|uniref:Uncharacterized protein n=1 Tax=Handroanthus impetiginosus TaxID=429701 RepID=A0A2G9GP79_9LAMI|nr:hypothetical protein CDL12_20331 [Handroanthus impetiginosus]